MLGCSSLVWHRPPMAGTGRVASSRAIGRATSCTRRSTRPGFANQPTSVRADDGLALTDAYLAAAVRCAPPMNRPTIVERDNCAPYLVRELAALPRVRVIVALGAFAWDAALRTISSSDVDPQVAAPPEVRSRSRGSHRALSADRVISSQPAEHVHGPAPSTDAGSGPPPRGRARRDLTSAVLTAARRTSASPSAGMLA